MNGAPHNLFEILALKVKEEWNLQGQKLEAFTSLATRSLEDFQYHLSQDQFDALLAEWLLKSGRVPDQINLHNTFGEPPVTIYNDGKFVVDLYIWIGCDTSIHSHGFRGAFRLLHGRSLHETFNVSTENEIAPDVCLTKLAKPRLELLKAGDVRMISAGRELTHRVIHLDEPTVTLCVKTINETALSQWHHFTNGLAIQKRHLDPSLIKRLYYFQYLMNQNGQRAEPFLRELLESLDISTSMNLAEDISMGSYGLSEDIAQFVLEQIYGRFEKDEWFKLYQESAETQAGELEFSHCNSPLLRLAAHLLNTGVAWTEAAPLLSAINEGRAVSKQDVEKRLFALCGESHSFLDT